MAKSEYTLGQVNLNNRPAKGPMKIAEKPKDFKSAVIALLKFINAFIPRLLVAAFCSIAAVVLMLFGPDMASKITDLIEEGMFSGAIDFEHIITYALIALVLYLSSSLLTYIQSYSLATISQEIQRYICQEISKKLNRIPLSRFDSASFGDLLSRVTNDADTIGMSFKNAATEIIIAVATFAGCAIMMALTNVPLTIISIASSLIGIFLMNKIINVSQKYFSLRQRYLGEVNGHIEEMFAGHLIVKACNGEEESTKEFDRLNKLLYENNWKSQFLSGLMRPMMEFIGNFGYVAVCVVGAIFTKNGTIAFSTIIAFILYVKMYTQPLGQVAQAITNLQSEVAASERVLSFLNEPEVEDESAKNEVLAKEDVKGEVVFENVNFGYTPDKTIINNFSIAIKPGQKVAIVGPTGAGKTTLVNLLMRFYELNSGAIYIDGHKTSDLTRENVHELFCMVLQDTWLFEGTIKENIIYSMEGISDEQVKEACKTVGLDHFISSLPLGYNTPLSDDFNISAGQRQLITIARAMIENAPLLILDEATSSVDTRTEQVIQNAMDALTKGRTSFTIAHRLSTIRNADVIIVMKDGDIVETGTHDELLAKGGFYKQLWTSQFVNAEAI
ncbi:MAG: ABC transporter ATP-binding protein [Erysipelotrichaceae bacterium]|nr:ABC transporter ATP-binding protein [Erysipelotrichaceae bacterium]